MSSCLAYFIWLSDSTLSLRSGVRQTHPGKIVAGSQYHHRHAYEAPGEFGPVRTLDHRMIPVVRLTLSNMGKQHSAAEQDCVSPTSRPGYNASQGRLRPGRMHTPHRPKASATVWLRAGFYTTVPRAIGHEPLTGMYSRWGEKHGSTRLRSLSLPAHCRPHTYSLGWIAK